MRSVTRLLLILTALSFAAAPMFGNAVITIVNNNAPGVGFNDPTPAAPVGGNSGTTKGQQALNAFNYAASVWGSTLDSNVQIFILLRSSRWHPVPPLPASWEAPERRNIFSDFGSIPPFPGSEFPNIWYHSALADKRAGAELNPGFATFAPVSTATSESERAFRPCTGTTDWTATTGPISTSPPSSFTSSLTGSASRSSEASPLVRFWADKATFTRGRFSTSPPENSGRA